MAEPEHAEDLYRGGGKGAAQIGAAAEPAAVVVMVEMLGELGGVTLSDPASYGEPGLVWGAVVTKSWIIQHNLELARVHVEDRRISR